MEKTTLKVITLENQNGTHYLIEKNGFPLFLESSYKEPQYLDSANECLEGIFDFEIIPVDEKNDPVAKEVSFLNRTYHSICKVIYNGNEAYATLDWKVIDDYTVTIKFWFKENDKFFTRHDDYEHFVKTVLFQE